ncbi:MAG: hypothetical protein ABSG56_25850 [Bryobacteraceae bacterium]|jgi:hypothetical protein
MKQTDHPPTPTAAQINANREDAKKSTGPRTAAGKEASSGSQGSIAFDATQYNTL